MFDIEKMKAHEIHSEKALRKIIPPHPSLLNKRIQPSLDFFSNEFLEQSCLAILGINHPNSKMTPLDYQKSIIIKDDNTMIIKHSDHPFSSKNTSTHYQASLLFMVSGIGHNLRVNGKLTYFSETHLRFKIESVYFHCARAMARSEFWTKKNTQAISVFNIIEHSPYALIKTINDQGKTEISPRGDQPGFIKIINENTLFLPERPGNKVAVSLRNILQSSTIELLILVPQTLYTLNIAGQAYVTSDPALLEICSVNGKLPKTGIVIKVTSQSFQICQALENSGLWDREKAVDKQSITPFPKALSSHMNGTGLMGKATTTVVGAIVKHDMNHLY